MSGEIVRRVGQPYIADNIHLRYMSSLTNQEAERLKGKQIEKIESDQYSLILTFTDGDKLIVEGFTLNEDDGSKDSLDIRLVEQIIKLNI